MTMNENDKQAQPVAWVRRHPDGALTAEFLEDAVIEPVRKKSGAWVPLYTTPPADAQQLPTEDQLFEIAKRVIPAVEKAMGLHPAPAVAPAEVVRELVGAIQAAIDCGMVPTMSARSGGACAHVEQLKVADQMRDALKSAKEHGL